MLNPGASHPEISGHGAPFSFPQFAKGTPARAVRRVVGPFPNRALIRSRPGFDKCSNASIRFAPHQCAAVLYCMRPAWSYMSLRISDWKWACVAAPGLVGLAACVMFVVHPGGFETQIGWFLVLLPGAFAGYPLSDHVHRLVPRAEPIVFWTLIVGLSFLWYWGISYSMIKIFRAAVRTLER